MEQPSTLTGASAPGADQRQAPYLAALRGYCDRDPGRFHVPGHKGGVGTDGELLSTLGDAAFRLDVPLIIPGIDVGEDPTPLHRAQQLAAEAWGARRSWFLTNGATQGNHALCLALSHLGGEVVVQRNVHGSTIGGLVLSGMRPVFVGPELNTELGVAHCVTPQTLEVTLADSPSPCAVIVVSPTYFGAVADVRGLAEVAHAWDVPLIVDEAWGAHFTFHEALPADALACGADVVISGAHKLVGSLTQSALLHVGSGPHAPDEGLIDRALTLVSSTSPSSLLLGSLDGARRHAVTEGHASVEASITAVARLRAAIRELPGLDVLDERLLRHGGVYDYDPLRLAIDVRETGVSGYELAAVLRVQSDIHLELCSNDLLVALFGISAPAGEQAERLIEGLRHGLATLMQPGRTRYRDHLPPPPRWGPLAMTPREAFFGRHEVVRMDDAPGRIAAESIAAYPPGIPNALPGERLNEATCRYLQGTLAEGGSVRGPRDPSLRTLTVVAEER